MGQVSALSSISGSSRLEARGTEVGLVEGMGTVHHFGRRGRAGGEDGAQRLMAVQHRREVLHFLCELFDFLAQGCILFLQVFTLL